MKAFLDTNILLDVLLGREPFVAEAADLWALCERETVDGFLTRNLKDFPKGAAIPIMTPGEFLRLDQF